ncbi:MAG: dipeptide ABC transporter ATP-binding protein [Candidatus Hydrogenedentota bacterium]
MSDSATETLLSVDDLAVYFPVRSGVFSRVSGHVRAVDGVSFDIPKGKTLSLVGESGSGKTTTGRAILRLIEPTRGTVTYNGQTLTDLDRKSMRSLRKEMQLIFQDPYGSLNPRMTVYSVLAEAMKAHKLVGKEGLRDRVMELIQLVGLPPEASDRYPNEFSGGQRQRIGIARALAVEPSLIIADEPVSALDVSIQAQILNLLKDLQEKLNLTYLFIGHDLSVIQHISDYVAVMYLGRIVEIGTSEDIFRNPVHPYTKALLSAVPVTTPGAHTDRQILTGDIPSPIDPPPGCHFHPRCPDREDRCTRAQTVLVKHDGAHRVACHVHAPVEDVV